MFHIFLSSHHRALANLETHLRRRIIHELAKPRSTIASSSPLGRRGLIRVSSTCTSVSGMRGLLSGG